MSCTCDRICYCRESAALARGAFFDCGVDEVGRGPLAGPVTAAAVRLEPDCIPEGLNDSKKLTAARRGALAGELRGCTRFFVAHATVEEIDEINILQASHLAMTRAIAGLGQTPDHALIDGNLLPKALPCPGEAVIGGDARSLSIAAASILAKTVRDALMVGLAQQHPGYGWESNMGYGTAAHLRALRDIGVTAHHRRSFKPVYNILYQDKSVTA